MNKIPRIFCVTLKETPLRTKGFLELADAAGLTAELFYGILGSKTGLVPKFPNELECPNENVMLSEQAIGCNLSHYILWNVLKYFPDDEFLIFEDDAIIPVDFKEKFEAFYDKLPSDWQMAYVGWIEFVNDKSYTAIDTGVCIRIPSATHAYLVKKSLLDDLCACLLPFQSNIDLTIIHRLLNKIKYYVADPSIVGQRSYCNISDPTWNSLVYDWKHDFYGCKSKLLRDLALLDGWYSLERNVKEKWKWSKDRFDIRVPREIDSISLICSSPVDTMVEFIIAAEKINVDVTAGDNTIILSTKNNTNISGNVISPFIPSDHDINSMDSRKLGICLKGIAFNMDINTIHIPVDTIPIMP